MSARAHSLPTRQGEWARTLLLAASILTIVASYTLVKAVRDAVFLAKFGTTAQAFLGGAGPAAIGAILGVSIPLALELTEPWQWGVLAAAAISLLLLRRGVVLTLIGCGIAGAAVVLLGGAVP